MPSWILAVGIVVLVLGVAYGVRSQINGLLGTSTTGSGARPVIWWVVDDSQVNAREWLDWGNRGTQEPNEPYLKVTLKRARELWGSGFDIQPLVGRKAVFTKLGDMHVPMEVPPALWMPWCRAALLSKFGGLWLDGSVLPIGSAADLHGRLASSDCLTFGSDPDEAIQGSHGADTKLVPAAGPSAGWAAVPGHPVWSGLERDLRALILKGDQSWSSPEARRSTRFLWDKHCSGVVKVDRAAEVSRDMYGRRLELDTLLTETDWPTGGRKGGLWTPLPGGRDGLERARLFGWFTRMSEEQIAESDFLWARWARS